MTTPETPTPAIYASLAAIMDEIEAVPKNKTGHQNAKYRGIDDAYNALHPLLAKHKVLIVPVVKDILINDQLTTLKVDYRFISLVDGSDIVITTVGQGKGNDDKSSNKALSGAHKYAIYQAFCIPTKDLDDGDATQTPPAEDGDATHPKVLASEQGIPNERAQKKAAADEIMQIMAAHQLDRAQYTEITKFSSINALKLPELLAALTMLREWASAKQSAEAA